MEKWNENGQKKKTETSIIGTIHLCSNTVELENALSYEINIRRGLNKLKKLMFLQ